MLSPCCVVTLVNFYYRGFKEVHLILTHLIRMTHWAKRLVFQVKTNSLTIWFCILYNFYSTKWFSSKTTCYLPPIMVYVIDDVAQNPVYTCKQKKKLVIVCTSISIRSPFVQWHKSWNCHLLVLKSCRRAQNTGNTGLMFQKWYWTCQTPNRPPVMKMQNDLLRFLKLSFKIN